MTDFKNTQAEIIARNRTSESWGPTEKSLDERWAQFEREAKQYFPNLDMEAAKKDFYMRYGN